jgi:hypothetical protein
VILLSLPRVDLSLLLAALGFFALATTARRNIPLFVFSALPLVGAQIEVVVRRLGRIPLPFPARRSLGTISSLLVIGNFLGEAMDGCTSGTSGEVSLDRRRAHPQAAMDHDSRRAGGTLNDIDAGLLPLAGYPKRRFHRRERRRRRSAVRSVQPRVLDTVEGARRALPFDYAVLSTGSVISGS